LAEALKMKQPEALKAIETLSAGNSRVKSIIERIAHGGFDDDVLDKLEKILPKEEPPRTPRSFREALEALQRKGKAHHPHKPAGGNPVRDEKRYADKLKEQESERRKAFGTSRVSRFDVVRERPDNQEARNFLAQEYGGKCQVTGTTFVKANGENYFVAVSLIHGNGAEYANSAGNMLCLGAETAARFMYGPFEWVDDLASKIESFRTAAAGGSEVDRTIRIRLGDDDKALRFSEAHFLRLKTLWQHD
jgi:hypothetical protein